MPKPRRNIPWLDKRGEVYTAFWNVEGRRLPLSFSLRTKDEVVAHVRFAAFLTEGRDIFENKAGQAKPGLTVAAALDDYYREHIVGNVSDVTRIETSIRHLKLGFPDMLLKDVNAAACLRYLMLRQKGVIRGRSKNTRVPGRVDQATVRKELGTLRAAVSHAIEFDRLKQSERPVVKLPPANSESEAKWLTKEELAEVRRNATGYLLDFINLAYYTGSRKTAIETLTIYQVKLRQNQIALAKPGERRTKKRRPTVQIDPRVRPVVERLMAEAAKAKRTTLFPSGFRSYTKFRALLGRLGLHDKANPHVLRHSRASHLLQDGASTWQVAKLLGNTEAMVERVYGHAAAKTMDNLFLLDQDAETAR